MLERAKVIRSTAIEPALALLPDRMSSESALRMLVAIGLQESRLLYRRQFGNGPARGLWQFERGGGVLGVLKHLSSREHALAVCKARGVAPLSPDVWAALEHDDILAAAFARLLLWTHPKPLPVDVVGGWDLYISTWRPGKPHPNTWRDYWEVADMVVRP